MYNKKFKKGKKHNMIQSQIQKKEGERAYNHGTTWKPFMCEKVRKKTKEAFITICNAKMFPFFY